MRIFTLDIEVESEYGFPDPVSVAEEVLLITVQDYNTKEIITWGVEKYGKFQNKQSNVDYRPCYDEVHLLNSFMEWWSTDTPDVLTGWNVEYYDVPYLTRRMARVFGDDYIRNFPHGE